MKYYLALALETELEQLTVFWDVMLTVEYCAIMCDVMVT